MKYIDKYVGSQDEIYNQIKEMSKQFKQNTLVVEAEKVNIPTDKEFEYKIKYENDEYEGSLAIKISWVKAEKEEEEELEEEEED